MTSRDGKNKGKGRGKKGENNSKEAVIPIPVLGLKHKQHNRHLLTGLNDLRKTYKLCDVTLQICGGEVHAHKNVLAVCSDYFMAMFTTGLEEAQSGMVNMDGVTYEAIKNIIDYMYTGSLAAPGDELQDLLIAADLLQMTEVKRSVATVMASFIEEANCLGIYFFGKQFGCVELWEKSQRLIKKRIVTVCSLPEFLDLTADNLRTVLQFPDLTLGERGEDDILDAIVRWVEHDPKRQKDLSRLLKDVHWKGVSKEGLELVKTRHPEWTASISIALQTDEKSGRPPQQCIYALCGYLQSRTGPTCPRLDTVERYIPSENHWEMVAKFPFLPVYLKAFNINQKLVVVSAIKTRPPVDGQPDRTDVMVHTLNIALNAWEDMSAHMGAGVADKIVTLINQGLSMCYCSDTHRLYLLTLTEFGYVNVEEKDGETYLSTYVPLNPLPPPEDQHYIERSCGLVAHGGKVFVIGGQLRRSATEADSCQEVWMYDEESKQWVERSPMKEKRAGLSTAVMGKYVYAIGGMDRIRLKTVERYDVEADCWEKMPDMLKHRSCAQAAALNNSIYVIGGKSYGHNMLPSGARKVLNTVETLDSDVKQWEPVANMFKNRCLFSVTVL